MQSQVSTSTSLYQFLIHTFWELHQRAILGTCDLLDILTKWWGDITWPKKTQWQRQMQRQRQWKRQLHFRDFHQRAIQETCSLWDIWSKWWGDMTWPKKYNDKDEYKDKNNDQDKDIFHAYPWVCLTGSMTMCVFLVCKKYKAQRRLTFDPCLFHVSPKLRCVSSSAQAAPLSLPRLQAKRPRLVAHLKLLRREFFLQKILLRWCPRRQILVLLCWGRRKQNQPVRKGSASSRIWRAAIKTTLRHRWWGSAMAQETAWKVEGWTTKVGWRLWLTQAWRGRGSSWQIPFLSLWAGFDSCNSCPRK